jgi:hypothetical protein
MKALTEAQTKNDFISRKCMRYLLHLVAFRAGSALKVTKNKLNEMLKEDNLVRDQS